MQVLISLCTEGMFSLVSANDSFVMYPAIESQSPTLYILASIRRYSHISVEAGLKHSVLGSFAPGLISYGISPIYGFLGTTVFDEIYLLL